MDKHNYCIIMAGGVGSRFWPISRKEKPKQFIDILGVGRTLLQQTFDRFTAIIPSENIFIVTNETYRDIVLEQLPDLTAEQVLLEPSRKNTAPCIAYAAFKIKKKDPEANLVVAPSDHLITKEDAFRQVITEGLNFAKNRRALLTLGIKPSRPETGYGYIQINNNEEKDGDFARVKTFTEKPDYEMAKIFYESGDFFWNSGIFIWSMDSITEAFEKHLSDIYILFANGNEHYFTQSEGEFIKKTYNDCKSISIDYGVMEKAENVYVLAADLGWSDLGTWGSLYEQKDKDKRKNTVSGDNVMIYDSKNCLVNVPDDKLVVLQGMNNFIVVESGNMLLVCNRNDEQKIKEFVSDIEKKKGESYL